MVKKKNVKFFPSFPPPYKTNSSPVLSPILRINFISTTDSFIIIFIMGNVSYYLFGFCSSSSSCFLYPRLKWHAFTNETFQGAKAQMKRDRNAKDAKGVGKSQLKTVCVLISFLFRLLRGRKSHTHYNIEWSGKGYPMCCVQINLSQDNSGAGVDWTCQQ